ncbi:MAG: hypothetical protein FWG90_05815 [Oscillospiraceae bacterium]|nr:hypothetical protein [Oscillospiraceae bacterium]
MNTKVNNIPMPSENEKAHSVELIINNGLPPRKSLISVITKLTENLGVKNIFSGVEDCALVALLLSIIGFFVWAGLFKSNSIQVKCPYFTLFTVTPLFYLAANILAAWKEDMAGVTELLRACKYTAAHLTALRMALFSLVNMLLVIPSAAILSIASDELEFLKLLLVSMSSLFIYSAFTAMILFKSAFKPSIILPVIWFLALGVLMSAIRIKTEEFLMNLSILTFALCMIISAVIYIILLDIFVKKGGKEYAYS